MLLLLALQAVWIITSRCLGMQTSQHHMKVSEYWQLEADENARQKKSYDATRGGAGASSRCCPSSNNSSLMVHLESTFVRAMVSGQLTAATGGGAGGQLAFTRACGALQGLALCRARLKLRPQLAQRRCRRRQPWSSLPEQCWN